MSDPTPAPTGASDSGDAPTLPEATAAIPATAAAPTDATTPPIPDDEHVDKLLAREDIQAHIAKVRESVSEVQAQAEWPYFDDLFFLRYALSFPKVPEAIKAVRKALQWRKDNAELLANVPENAWSDDATHGALGHVFKEMSKYQVASVWNPDCVADKGFVVIVRGAMGRPKLLYTHLTHDENVAMNYTFRESGYKYCDAVTRRTRRLAKQTMFFDAGGMKFSEMMDPKQQKVFGEVSKVSSFAYPQLIRKMCLVNAPKFMTVIMQIAKAFLPKSTTSKMEMFDSLKTFHASPFAHDLVRIEHLPEFLGGKVPDSELPPRLTGALVPKFVDGAEDDYVEEHVMARTIRTTKIAVPCANSTVVLKAYIKHFGINFDVALEHGEFVPPADGADADGDAPATEAATADPATQFKLDGRKTVLKTLGKLKSEEATTRTVFAGVGPGVLTITWDNHHSHFRNKRVFHLVTVEIEQDGSGGSGEAGGAGGGGGKAAEE